MTFSELKIGDTFDFIKNAPASASFYLRCAKISARRYVDEKGTVHQVGSVHVNVCHAEPRSAE